MIRLAIVVEGETEEEFVKQVLTKHLSSCGVIPHAIMPRRRGITSGGALRVNQLAGQMYKLYWNFDFVTSLFDLYGFPAEQVASPSKTSRDGSMKKWTSYSERTGIARECSPTSRDMSSKDCCSLMSEPSCLCLVFLSRPYSR